MFENILKSLVFLVFPICIYILHSVWKSPQSPIQYCERSELRLHFEWPKVDWKWSILALKNLMAYVQTVLPDRSILIGQKWLEKAKIEKFKCDILGDFQTLCSWSLGKLGIKLFPLFFFGSLSPPPYWFVWATRQPRGLRPHYWGKLHLLKVGCHPGY